MRSWSMSVSRERLKQLASELAADGLQTELRVGDLDDPIPALLAISDPHGNRVDLLGGLRGLEPAAFSRTVTLETPCFSVVIRWTWIWCARSRSAMGVRRRRYWNL